MKTKIFITAVLLIMSLTSMAQSVLTVKVGRTETDLQLSEEPVMTIGSNIVVTDGTTTLTYSTDKRVTLIAQKKASATVSSANYATFVAPFNIKTIPTGVNAYAVQMGNGYVHLEPVTAIPSGECVILENEGTYTFASTNASVALGTTNILQSSATDFTADGTQYGLSSKNGVVGFYKVQSGTTIAAGKGYFVSASGAREYFGFDEEAEAVENVVNVENTNNDIYNIQGQKLQKAQKGINIIGGKKVIIK